MKQIIRKSEYKNMYYGIFAISIVFILLIFGYVKNSVQYIDKKTYLSLLENGQILNAKIEEQEVVLYTVDKKYAIVKDGIDLSQLLEKTPVEIEKDYSFLEDLLLLGILFLFFILLGVYGKKQKEKLEKQNEQLKEKSAQASVFADPIEMPKISPSLSSITFADVAGIESVKDELKEIVDFLKNPQKYKKYGIRTPKGTLLVGPPGVGKTLIAKAVAGEAGAPFFYQSGSSFAQIYVGMGAKRVRELFAKAKRYSPSIIFIDEIDAVGKARGGFRNDEREATLNQLLTEMDGFEDNSGIIIIGATNKIEMLDEALLRAGRFDRRIFVPLPDIGERKAILEVYLRDKPYVGDVEKIAKMTVGFSGASLSTLVNEAAIYALRKNSPHILDSDFEAVKEKVSAGMKKVLSFSEEEKEIQAFYQAAKGILAYWLDIDFEKIAILSDDIKDEGQEIESFSRMFSRMKVYLAGIAVCKIRYGETFSNSKDDLESARVLAKEMVENYGMGKSLTPNSADISDILERGLEEAIKFLEGMREPLELVADKINQEESITKEEMKSVLGKVFEF